MSTAVALPFRIGARTLGSIRRRLIRVPLALDDVLSGRVPALPALADDADGHAITSLPADRAPPAAGLIAFERQRYTRYWVDLTIGYDAWWAGLSANSRAALKRKAKRLGAHEVRAYRTSDQLATFHALARDVAATTYQERLLGAGLPDTPAFVAQMLAAAAGDSVRAWLLFVEGRAVAYLYCPARGDTLIYEYVGHDPGLADRSPGVVLQWTALRDLYAEGRFARYDFTEGEGQHKRSMATGGIACADWLLLRPTIANRAALAALGGFDKAVALAKRTVHRLGFEALARRLRRG